MTKNIKKSIFIYTITISLFLGACSNNSDKQTEYVENQEMTLSFSFGERSGTFTGHLLNDIPDGIGKFVSENGSGVKWTYIGEWENGHFNGNGTSWYDNGEIYSSTYNMDVASGSALFLFENDLVYYGDVKDDQQTGNGTILSLSGSYKGELTDGLINGKGTLYYPDGNKFEGIFKNNSINGEGTLFYPNGGKVIGTFSADASGLTGTGIYYPADGESSECTIENGELHISKSNTPKPNIKSTTKPSKTKSPKKTPKPTKKPKHRKGDSIIGISNQDIHDVDATFRADKVRNDSTGNWRISVIANNIDMLKYALSYYKWKFLDDDEIHAIVNFNYNTTTKISVMGNMLDVTVHEYVDGEEHDANLLFGGMLLNEYFVYLDNGDIEKVQ